MLPALLLTASCKDKKQSSSNWAAEYEVEAAIDETFRPIMENLVQTFAMSKPEARMKPLYVSEDSALRLLVRDSLRCCIVTRKLTEQEKQLIEGRRLGATQALIATDAIALVVNKANADSLLSLDEVRGIVSGRITRWEQLKHHSQSGPLNLVFDNSGSSTVRFMRDSLCGGKELQGNVFASEGGTNTSVLDMVKNDRSLIGVVGANWLMQQDGTALSDFSKLDVNVIRVSRTDDEFAKYVRPYQYYIATADYPLLRSVYIIHTDPRKQSMLRNFYFFVKGQKGQTIICNNSQMLPITPVQIKSVSNNH